MSNSIFSRYSQGENRVTATLMAVLKQLGMDAVEFLLGREVRVFVPDGGGSFLKNLMCDQDPEIEPCLMDPNPHEDAPLQGAEECVGVVDDTEGQSIVQSCINT